MKTLTLKNLFEENNINIEFNEIENFIKLNLSDDDRLYKAIIMRHKENKSYQEIADYFQVSKQRAAYLVRHALWLLKRRYEYPFHLLFTGNVAKYLIIFGIKNLNDLCNYTEEEISNINGIGKSGIEEILTVMRDHGLKFKNSHNNCGDNLTWTLDNEGTLTISGTGDMYNYHDTLKAPWFLNKELIKNVVVCTGVTSIGRHAFDGCTNIRKIVLPDTIKYFGAFNL